MGHPPAAAHPRELSRRVLLQAATALPLAGALGCSRKDGERPNLLLFVADDLGWRDLGAYGNRAVTTPALDRLASEGCRCDRMYTPVSICLPSRSCTYTGLHPHQNGATGIAAIHDDVPVWPELLAAAGFHTGLIGKLHVRPPARFVFDFSAQTVLNAPEGREPGFFVEQARAFLAARDKSKPFALVVNFHDPHRPFPRRGPGDALPQGVGAFHDPARVELAPFLADTPVVRHELAQYYDAIERMDTSFGRTLQLFDEAGLAANTLVLFKSDNGMPFPFAKTTLYEAGIHLPLIARWPGVIPSGSSNAALISTLDILPTALDLAGRPAEARLPGSSLLPLLRQQPFAEREDVFAEHTDHRRKPSVPSRALVSKRWKYIRNFRSGTRFHNSDMESPSWTSMLERAKDDPVLAGRVALLEYRPKEELYDLASDPCELANLAGDSATTGLRDELANRLRAWLTASDDPALAEWDS